MELESLEQYRNRLNSCNNDSGDSILICASSAMHTVIGDKTDQDLLTSALKNIQKSYPNDSKLEQTISIIRNPKKDFMNLDIIPQFCYPYLCYGLQLFLHQHPKAPVVKQQNLHHARKNGNAKHWCNGLEQDVSNMFSTTGKILSSSKSKQVMCKALSKQEQ